MAKILLTIIILLALAFIVIAIYCSLVIAGRSDNDSKRNNSGGNNGEMFLGKQICPRCKTGEYTYDLDPKSEACPYIGCCRRNKCSFYKPLDKHSKSRACKKGKSDDNVVLEKTYNMIQNSV